MNRSLLNYSSCFLLPLGFFLWVAWVCADDWNHDPNYSYGWFILPVSLYFVYRRFSHADFSTFRPSNVPGFLLYPVPLIVLCLELIRLTPIFWRTIPWTIYLTGVLVTLILVYHHLGRTGIRTIYFPLIFFALAIPWPTFIEITIIREFSYWVAQIVGELLLLSGIFCQVQGKIIQLANGSVGVDEACSGLRSLQAALMVGFAVGEWFLFSKLNRIGLITLSVLAAFFSNLVRAYVLSLLIVTGGEPLFNQWHDTVGMVAMVGLTLGIVLIAKIFPTSASSLPKKTELTFSTVWTRLGKTLPCWWQGMLVSAATLIAFAAAHFWYAIHERQPSPTTPFLTSALWNENVTRQEPPPSVVEILRSDSGGYKLMRSPLYGDLIAYHFFWKPARSNGKVFFHRPDVCMPGGGWTQIGTASVTRGILNGRETAIHHFRFNRGNQTTNLYWICWIDDRSIAFEGSASTYLQSSFLPEFIRLGKRVFSVEFFGLATEATPETEADWNQLLNELGDFSFELTP